MTQNQVVNPNPQAAAADTPTTPAPMLTPAQVIEQLHALMAQVPDVPSLTKEERKLLRRGEKVPDSELQAAINVVEASETVAHVVGRPADGVRQIVEDSNRWGAVVNEVKMVLKGIVDANLVRHSGPASSPFRRMPWASSWRVIRRMLRSSSTWRR